MIKKYNIICSVFIGTVFLLGCSQGNELPAGVEKGAEFDRKINLYKLVQNGKRKLWSDSGKLYAVIEVNASDLENGNAETYMPATGAVLSRGNYKDGQKDGLWFWYFPDGKVYYKQEFAFGKKRSYWIETNLIGNEHGLYERYYFDGKLEEKGQFDSGYKTGEWVKYYRNGNIEYKGKFLKDKRVGKWFQYFSDGKTESEELYDEKGKLIERKTFFPDGKPRCIQKQNEPYQCA